MISVLEDCLFQVTTINGKNKSVGLRQLLARAHEFSDICGRTPTGRLALMRLCVAFLEDAFQPREMEERIELLENGCFDMDRIDAYIRECEKGKPRFLLDDEEHPFMQMAYDQDVDANAEKPVAALFVDIPSGNNHIHLEHRPIEDITADAAEAFEGMLETYMFCTAAAQGYPSGVNNTNPVYCIIQGRTLFETLVLNMVSEEELMNNIPFGEGLVPWRLEKNIKPKETVASISFMEALTWQPRRLTLVFDDDQRVRRVYMQQGLNFVGDGRWRDPWVPFRRKKDGSDASVKPEIGRALWRDAGSIVSTLGNNSLAPVPVANVHEVWNDIPNGIVPVEAVGLITNQASILGISRELLRIPEALLEDADRAGRFKTWIELVEEIYSVTVRIIASEYERETARFVGETFLQNMHDEVFGPSLERLVAANSVEAFDAADKAFGKALFAALRENMRRILEETGTSVQSIKRQNVVEGKAMGYCVKRLKEGNRI